MDSPAPDGKERFLTAPMIAAAAVAYNTAVGALIIPICLGVNFLMLITKTTRTVNIDLWNYWLFMEWIVY